MAPARMLATAPPAAHQAPTSEWTPEHVLFHLTTLIEQRDVLYAQRFEMQDKAVVTAFAASEHAIRDALGAVERSTLTAVATTEKALGLAEANAERWRTDAGHWRDVMRSDHQELKERLDLLTGGGAGKTQMWGLIVGAIGAVSTIGAIVMLFLSK